MIVFKNYFKIVKKSLPLIIMYAGIFIFFAVLSTSSSKTQANFEITKPNIAIINNDSNTKIIETFKKYISENAKIKDIENKDDSLKDALFYRQVDMIIIIPKSYTSDILNNKNPKIETMKVPDSADSMYLELVLNKYINVTNAYIKSGMNEEEISNIILDTLKSTVSIERESKKVSNTSLQSYYNFSNYSLLAICIYVIGTVLVTFHEKTIKKRNLISSTSYKKINMQLYIANLVLTLSIWAVFVGISFILYRDSMLTTNGLLLTINSFLFSMVALSIGFMVGLLVKNKEAQSGIVNIVALGSSFLCGAFVPQEYLGSQILNASKIFPSYWFITNNNIIASLTEFNLSNLKPVYTNMFIMICYIIGIFLVTNVISRILRKHN